MLFFYTHTPVLGVNCATKHVIGAARKGMKRLHSHFEKSLKCLHHYYIPIVHPCFTFHRLTLDKYLSLSVCPQIIQIHTMAGFRLFGAISVVALLSQVAALQVPAGPYTPANVSGNDVDLLEFPLNLEYLEAEFFLWSSLGYGLDEIASDLVGGGPAPTKAQKANLEPDVLDVVTQFGYQEVGHIRAIKSTVPGFARPQLDLSPEAFANVFDAAFGATLNPPFNPYINGLTYLLAVYIIPYVGLTGYVDTSAYLTDPTAKRLVAGLLGAKSGQDAVVRSLLYSKLNQTVPPYTYTVAEFTDKISSLRDSLGHSGVVDEGLIVSTKLGAEGKIGGNILAGDSYSIAYSRNAAQILRIVYSTGNESSPGGFYPNGGLGKIALSFLHHK